MKLRAVRHNGYNLDSNHNPILYYPYVKEDTLNKYNFYVVEEYIDEMELVFGGMTRLKLPFYNAQNLGWNCTVDWGNGFVQNYIYPTIPDYTYPITGDYTVKITGFLSGFSFEYVEQSYAQYLKEIISIGNIGIKTLSFYQCGNLTKVHDGVFDNFNKWDMTNLTFAFINCTNLNYIPPYLFKDFINVETFYYTFAGCSKLPYIPNGVFDNCVKVKTFQATFLSCSLLESVPFGLFNSCTEVINFQSTFSQNTNLQSLPSFNNCLKVMDFNTTFFRCINVIGNAEPLWLRTNPTPTGDDCFDGCTSLLNYANIPNNWK